jgi:hypothetical protein
MFQSYDHLQLDIFFQNLFYCFVWYLVNFVKLFVAMNWSIFIIKVLLLLLLGYIMNITKK